MNTDYKPLVISLENSMGLIFYSNLSSLLLSKPVSFFLLILLYFYGKINFGGCEYEGSWKISSSPVSFNINILFRCLGWKRKSKKESPLLPGRREYSVNFIIDSSSQYFLREHELKKPHSLFQRLKKHQALITKKKRRKFKILKCNSFRMFQLLTVSL